MDCANQLKHDMRDDLRNDESCSVDSIDRARLERRVLLKGLLYDDGGDGTEGVAKYDGCGLRRRAGIHGKYERTLYVKHPMDYGTVVAVVVATSCKEGDPRQDGEAGDEGVGHFFDPRPRHMADAASP